MRAERAHLLLIALAACSNDWTYVHLPSQEETVRSIVVVKEGGDYTLLAYDAERAPSALELEQGVLIVTVLHYRAPLSELGLPEGPLSIATDRDCASLQLPTADTVYQGGAGRPLVKVAVLTEAIARLRVAIPCPCVDFEVTPFEIPDGAEVRDAIRYDERRSLLVTDLGFLLVDEAGRTESIAAPMRMTTAFEDQQGVFWFGDAVGQLWLGDPLVSLRPTFTSSAISDVHRIAGWVAPDAFELLTVSNDLKLQRFDGETWTVLFSQTRVSNDQRANILSFAPGRALATLSNGAGLIHYDAAQINPVQLEDWDSARNGHVTALEQIEPFGLFIGTRLGRLFLRRSADNVFVEIEVRAEEQQPITDLLPFAGGLILVGRRGFIRQWHPASGFCPAINTNFQIDLERIAPLGARAFVTGGDSREMTNQGFVIRPVQP